MLDMRRTDQIVFARQFQLSRLEREHCAEKSTSTGLPRSIEKVLNFKIGFKDHEKVLNLAKKCIMH